MTNSRNEFRKTAKFRRQMREKKVVQKVKRKFNFRFELEQMCSKKSEKFKLLILVELFFNFQKLESNLS
jgi:hypothetical protein